MSNPAYTAFGERVVLATVEEEFDSEIILPATRNVQYVLGKALAVGEKAKDTIKVGLTYIFQVMMDVRTGAPMVPFHGAGDSRVAVQHYRDLIGCVSQAVVTDQTFHVVGQWVLLEGFTRQTSIIITPEAANQLADSVGFRVVQLGRPMEGVEVGDEVVVEKTRCNPMSIKPAAGSKKDYYYVDQQFIYAKLNKPELDVAKAVDVSTN